MEQPIKNFCLVCFKNKIKYFFKQNIDKPYGRVSSWYLLHNIYICNTLLQSEKVSILKIHTPSIIIHLLNTCLVGCFYTFLLNWFCHICRDPTLIPQTHTPRTLTPQDIYPLRHLPPSLPPATLSPQTINRPGQEWHVVARARPHTCLDRFRRAKDRTSKMFFGV